jgi:hypothetical protein
MQTPRHYHRQIHHKPTGEKIHQTEKTKTLTRGDFNSETERRDYRADFAERSRQKASQSKGRNTMGQQTLRRRLRFASTPLEQHPDGASILFAVTGSMMTEKILSRIIAG